MKLKVCCIKSPEFAKVEKSAANWIRENHDPTFEARTALKKIQDEDLALSVIDWAKRDSASGKAVKIVDYSDRCEESD